MNWRIILAVGLACTMAIPATAVASHMGAYQTIPTEHDDQGSSSEPDRECTTVLTPGPPPVLLCNRVIDSNNDYVAEPDANFDHLKVLAPGCTDDNGARQTNGLCGLWNVGAGTGTTGAESILPRHTQGIAHGSGPGLTGAGAVTLRFLDSRVDVQITSAGSNYINVNKKLEDNGVTAALRQVNPQLGNRLITGPASIWAWYGTWSDRNGNGVIDHLAPPGAVGTVYPDNEFVWGGSCLRFGGNPDGSTAHCQLDPTWSAMNGFEFPGNHHAFCGGLLIANPTTIGIECANTPADLPGHQVLGFIDTLFIPVLGGPGNGPFLSGCMTPWFTDPDLGCAIDPRKLDEIDEVAYGDPLLGPQGSVKPDMNYDERAGDLNINTRQYVFGLGWPSWHYDNSVVTRTTWVTTVGCATDQSSPNTVNLGTCKFVDVDKYDTWNVQLNDLLGGTVKPTARTGWVLVRDDLTVFQQTLAGAANNRIVYEAEQGPLQGQVDDQLFNPGFSREPNTAGDSYPGASFGSTCASDLARHNGWCNSYSGYKTGFHAWTDQQAFHSDYWSFPLAVLSGTQCVLCVAGAVTNVLPVLNLHAGDANVYDRTMSPGGYNFLGVLGLWKDRPQTYTETFIDLTTLQERNDVYTRAADGWTGNLINATGAFNYRGYVDESCTTEDGAGTHSYAQCHPYLDGNIQDPQQAGALDSGEWLGRCRTTNVVTNSGANIVTTLHVSGDWQFPVVVFRNHESQYTLQNSGDGGNEDLLAHLVVWPANGGDITIIGGCRVPVADQSGFYVSIDMIYLPLGNQGQDMTVTTTAQVLLDGGAVETVVDKDSYAAFGA
jgi:hypothetical protein